MNRLTNDTKLRLLLDLCDQLPPTGAIAECGVYEGGVLRELALKCPDRDVYGFDTFEGMPISLFNGYEHHSPGEFYCSLEQVQRNVSGISNVRLVKGLFPDSFCAI